jgi:putative transposase
MRHCDSILGSLLKPLSRRRFGAIVDRHDGDAYAKTYDSWDHLVTLIFAQLTRAESLRGVAVSWNAYAHHHYHLGAGRVSRSTLADANARRPTAVFAETFAMLAALADRRLRREGAAMLRLIDATPIPLDRLCRWADWNGRTRGLKLHVVYDPVLDRPHRVEVAAATVNDVEIGRAQPIEAGATYVFDKAYCDYAWWTRIDAAGATFITRQKTNAPYRRLARKPLRRTKGDGFTIIDDAKVRLVSQGKAKLPIAMRRVRVRRADGTRLTLITNDLRGPAVAIATLYKARWQIELLFRWLKQHLKLRKFLGRSENAIRLQLFAAMIAYLLLRLAAHASRSLLPALRFAELVRDCIFVRKPLDRLDKPPRQPNPHSLPNAKQLAFVYG